jgi:O-antigen ligase
LTTSHPDILRLTRLLRFVTVALDGGVAFLVVGSVVAIGAVHPWAYVPLWSVAALLAVLVGARGVAVRALRRRLGGGRITYHVSGRWVSAAGADGAKGWRFDLDRPLLGSAPLLAPGIAFVLLIVLQLTPVPTGVREILSPSHPAEHGWAPSTISTSATVRGLLFACALLAVHAAAGAAFTRRASRERFLRILAFTVPILGIAALFQHSSGLVRIYGVFKPQERGASIFGSFVNRNHFAAWTAIATALAIGLLDVRWRGYTDRVGARPNLRRRLSTLQSEDGIGLLATMTCVFVGIAALLASASRGGILAFVAAVALAILSRRRAGVVPISALAALFLSIGVAWLGLDRVATRFEELADDSPERVALWTDSLKQLRGGEWALGSGFNTFSAKASRSAPFALPAGATPWPAAVDDLARRHARIAIRTLESQPGHVWYREAHNDYLQVLVETGLIGLALVAWGVARVLVGARHEPWRLAALAAGLLHAAVDFPFQIPAIAVLFAVVAAARDPNAVR